MKRKIVSQSDTNITTIEQAYTKAWDEAKAAAKTAQPYQVNEDLKNILGGYDIKTGGFPAPTYIPSYSLTISWRIPLALQNTVAILKRDLLSRHPFLEQKILWQPPEHTHFDLFKIDRLNPKNGPPTPETINHRKNIAFHYLSYITRKLACPQLEISGLLLNKGGVLFLKGLAVNAAYDPILELRNSGMTALNNNITENPNSGFAAPQKQDDYCHITIGRLVQNLSADEYRAVIDDIDEHYYHHSFGRFVIDKAELTEETQSFATKRIIFPRKLTFLRQTAVSPVFWTI